MTLFTLTIGYWLHNLILCGYSLGRGWPLQSPVPWNRSDHLMYIICRENRHEHSRNRWGSEYLCTCCFLSVLLFKIIKVVSKWHFLVWHILVFLKILVYLSISVWIVYCFELETSNNISFWENFCISYTKSWQSEVKHF